MIKKMILLLKRCYYNYLIKISPNIVFVGYDEKNENPTYIKYAILFNNLHNLEIYEEYSIYNYGGTMIFTITQDEDINLNLTGFNNESYKNIKKIVFDLLNEFFESSDEKIIHEIDEKLKNKFYDIQIDNLSNIVDYIEYLPDLEILKLLDILIELTSVKKRFSNEPHSVGGKRVKAILRKYDGIKFIK